MDLLQGIAEQLEQEAKDGKYTEGQKESEKKASADKIKAVATTETSKAGSKIAETRTTPANKQDQSIKLNFTVGKDDGHDITYDLGRPGSHQIMLIGQNNYGKTDFTKTILANLISQNMTSELQLIIFNPTNHYVMFESLPCMLKPVITKPDEIKSALEWAMEELENRYSKFTSSKVSDIDEYNEQHKKDKLPHILVVIDDLEWVMEHDKQSESLIVKILQKSKLVGINLIILSSKASASELSGTFRANLPTIFTFNSPDNVIMSTYYYQWPKQVKTTVMDDKELSRICNSLAKKKA